VPRPTFWHCPRK